MKASLVQPCDVSLHVWKLTKRYLPAKKTQIKRQAFHTTCISILQIQWKHLIRTNKNITANDINTFVLRLVYRSLTIQLNREYQKLC